MKLDSTNIQGNAAISRNVTAGGNVDVKGDVTVDHHLRVKGWVDAPHIKGPLKGLYASEEALNAAYPRPRAGWYALVGDTLPADVWRAEAEGGVYRWVPTGEQGGETTLWLDQIEEDIKDMRDDVQGLKDMTAEGLIEGDSIGFTSTATEVRMHYRVKKPDGSCEPKEAALPMADDSVAGMMTPADRRKIAESTSKAEAAQAAAQAAEGAVTALAGTVGSAGGIAPLDSTGKVPAAFLPECGCGGSGDGETVRAEKELTWLSSIVAGVECDDRTTLGSGDNLCSVVYDSETRFLLLARYRVADEGGGVTGEGGEVIGPMRSGAILVAKYYRHWADEQDYGVVYDDGVKPFQSKLYVVKGNNTLYRADALGLLAFGGGSEGGESESRITEDEIDAMFD